MKMFIEIQDLYSIPKELIPKKLTNARPAFAYLKIKIKNCSDKYLKCTVLVNHSATVDNAYNIYIREIHSPIRWKEIDNLQRNLTHTEITLHTIKSDNVIFNPEEQYDLPSSIVKFYDEIESIICEPIKSENIIKKANLIRHYNSSSFTKEEDLFNEILRDGLKAGEKKREIIPASLYFKDIIKNSLSINDLGLFGNGDLRPDFILKNEDILYSAEVVEIVPKSKKQQDQYIKDNPIDLSEWDGESTMLYDDTRHFTESAPKKITKKNKFKFDARYTSSQCNINNEYKISEMLYNGLENLMYELEEKTNNLSSYVKSFKKNSLIIVWKWRPDFTIDSANTLCGILNGRLFNNGKNYWDNEVTFDEIIIMSSYNSKNVVTYKFQKESPNKFIPNIIDYASDFMGI